MKIDRDDLWAALTVLQQRHPTAAWQVGVITADKHAIHPFGPGVGVTLHGPAGEVVWQKAATFQEAMARAVDRLDRRIAGDKGA